MAKIAPPKTWRESRKLHKLLGKKGRLVGWTKVFAPAPGFENAVPYVVGLVKIGKQTFAGQIVGWEDKKLRKNGSVVASPRRLAAEGKEGLIRYGICWRIS